MQNKTNKNAIFSFVFSIISFFIFGWLSIAGVSLGIVALKEIKSTNEKGKGLAIAGLILGAIALVLYVMVLVK